MPVLPKKQLDTLKRLRGAGCVMLVKHAEKAVQGHGEGCDNHSSGVRQ